MCTTLNWGFAVAICSVGTTIHDSSPTTSSGGWSFNTPRRWTVFESLAVAIGSGREEREPSRSSCRICRLRLRRWGARHRRRLGTRQQAELTHKAIEVEVVGFPRDLLVL